MKLPLSPEVENAFAAVLEVPEAEQESFLAREYARDPELRSEVESLLRAHRAAGSFLEPPGRTAAHTYLSCSAATPSVPAAIGRYRIIRLLGEGSMGAVYEAEQEQPRRTVALKVIRGGIASPGLLRRFDQECQALGRLQHPGIAQIHEAGVDNELGPRPYFVMELIRGTSLLEYADSHQLTARERLEIVIKVCEAVHHAHQRGIIHRDLKPTNILVDDTGQPKILDFGVARATDRDAKATRQTHFGQLVGTLAYMSPEQVTDPLELDARSDVYALGIILFEVLAGRLPYNVSGLHDAVQTIREQDPERLSSINRSYRGDVETIVAKALEKDKARRYSSAAELATDIQRHLMDEPILARGPSTAYQLQKFARRHKALALAVGAVFVVLIAGIVVSTREAARANAQSATARAISEFLQNDLLAQAGAANQTPNTKPDPDLKVRTALDRAADRIAGRFDRQPQVEAALRNTVGVTYLDLGLYPEARRELEQALDLLAGASAGAR